MFDRIVVVDWSASATPKTGADSVWIAVGDPAVGDAADGEIVLSNPPTRHDALGELDGLIATSPGPMLLGVDFSLGYPAGTAHLFGAPRGAGHRWMAGRLADEIVDHEDNRNNRFEVADRLNRLAVGGPGPFWGCSPRRATDQLTTTKPDRHTDWPGRWRRTEEAMRAAGHRPFDCWQLLGVGSVGSQSLVGIAAIERLRRDHPDRIRLWPFATGLDVPDLAAHTVIVVEVWPSLWPVDVRQGEIRDAAQVRSTVQRLADADAGGEMRRLLAPSMCGADRSAVENEEGWVLGVVEGMR